MYFYIREMKSLKNNYSKYYYLVRVDDRILYGNGDSDYKSEIKEIMESFGY